MKLKWVLCVVTMCVVLLCAGATVAEAVEDLAVVATLEIDATFQEWSGLKDGRVHDGYLYLTTSQSGVDQGNAVLVVDIRNPMEPSVIAQIDGYYHYDVMAFLDHYLLLAQKQPTMVTGPEGLRVVDISNPAAPVLVGSYDTPSFPQGLVLHGGYAYLLTNSSGLYILNLSDPTNPQEVAWFSISGVSQALVSPEGGDAVLYVDTHNFYLGTISLSAVSLANPVEPLLLGSTTAYFVGDMCPVGDTLVIVDDNDTEADGRLVLFDGADPLTELGTYDLTYSGYLRLRAGVGDRHVYMSQTSAGDFQVLDVSTPSAPVQVAHCDTGLAGGNPIASTPTHIYMTGYNAESYLPTLIVAEALQVFDDVTWDNWAAAPIAACVKAAIVGGYPDGVYLPDAPVTRDQMAVFVARALAGGDELVPAPASTPTFLD
ncbi:MAG TPA: S-layer homology domain-containing protein, partial [Anaerolineae bacterium]|nr:S-layer homology domain-containing protein [Anaerolineae bacterium]